MAATAHADPAPTAEEIRRRLAAAFDPDFYRAIYVDITPEIDALEHYRTQGWREARDPVPWFSVTDYLADNPDVAARKIEPLCHFLTVGRRQGRDVAPSRHEIAYLERVAWTPPHWGQMTFGARPAAKVEAPAPAICPETARAAVAAAFDPAFYLAVNPDVATSGMAPLEHFLATGWREGRDPCAAFSVQDYLENNPDVAQSGLNPFAHYLIAGRAEGRRPKHDLGFRYDVIARMKPAAVRIAEAAVISASIAPDPPELLAQRLDRSRALHITFSHDDYLAHAGGVQLCVRRESAAFAARGVDHLHLHPAAAWPAMRAAGEPGPLGAMLNGRPLGILTAAAVREALVEAGVAHGAGRRTFAIHSLLGHDPDETADIVEAAGMDEGFFWLHDFASLCAGVHLLRNDVADCAAPPADSAACGICAYGPFRSRHTDGHRRLFERLALTVIAPAPATLAFWRSRTSLPFRRAVVLPHAALAPRKGGGKAANPPAGERPFRLVFAGMPTPLKGWPVFRELAQRFAGDPRFEFHHLGGRSDPAAPAAFQQVVVTEAEPLAMQAALEALAPDAALIWPLCRETFSFTAYEAAAAGAAIITGPDSGNVAAFAAEAGTGRVLADEAALGEAFETGEILTLSRAARRARISDLAYSQMTADLVPETAR
jgi:hypothetical protein